MGFPYSPVPSTHAFDGQKKVLVGAGKDQEFPSLLHVSWNVHKIHGNILTAFRTQSKNELSIDVLQVKRFVERLKIAQEAQ